MKAGEGPRFAFDQTRPAWSLGDEVLSALKSSRFSLSTRAVGAGRRHAVRRRRAAQVWRLRKA